MIKHFLQDSYSIADNAAKPLQQYYAGLPRFFAPYKDASDFGRSLAHPIIMPAILSAYTAVAAVVTANAALSCVFSLASFVATLAAGDPEAMGYTLFFFAASAIILPIAAAATVMFALAAVLSVPLLLLQIATRGLADCFLSPQQPEECPRDNDYLADDLSYETLKQAGYK